MKYTRENILNPRVNILYPRNTHEKNFWTQEKIFWTQEVPTRKNFKPTKYLRRVDGTMALDPREI